MFNRCQLIICCSNLISSESQSHNKQAHLSWCSQYESRVGRGKNQYPSFYMTIGAITANTSPVSSCGPHRVQWGPAVCTAAQFIDASVGFIHGYRSVLSCATVFIGSVLFGCEQQNKQGQIHLNPSEHSQGYGTQN